jgi:uncharacterized protein (DUF2147 family)
MKKVLLFLILFSPIIVLAQKNADDIVGYWLTAGNEQAKILISKSGNTYTGKIVWLKNPTKDGKARTDINNPDKAKRNLPIIGLTILQGFKFDGDDEWEKGSIYDPENGKTYRCYLYMKDKNTLKLRGYIGISLIGRTETWTRTSQ